MTKVMTVVGTRPEIIRLSETIKLLDRTVDHVLVHTGQNYDYNLNEIFFEELGLRAPDHYLGVDTASLGTVLGGVLIKTEEVLLAERPDAVLVLGDTNSCLAAVMAKRMRIPVYHMEAGNRCFDENVPEETNRRLVDHVADFNLVYTEHARRNLLAEGLHPRRILKTGSPMKEVLAAHADAIDALRRPRAAAADAAGLPPGERAPRGERRQPGSAATCCSTASRPSSRHRHARARSPPTRAPASGSTRWAADRRASPSTSRSASSTTTGCRSSAYCVLSDSGTISEESSLLDFPAVTLRDSIERPEALDTASILMTGLDADQRRRGRAVRRLGPGPGLSGARGLPDRRLLPARRGLHPLDPRALRELAGDPQPATDGSSTSPRSRPLAPVPVDEGHASRRRPGGHVRHARVGLQVPHPDPGRPDPQRRTGDLCGRPQRDARFLPRGMVAARGRRPSARTAWSTTAASPTAAGSSRSALAVVAGGCRGEVAGEHARPPIGSCS